VEKEILPISIHGSENFAGPVHDFFGRVGPPRKDACFSAFLVATRGCRGAPCSITLLIRATYVVTQVVTSGGSRFQLSLWLPVATQRGLSARQPAKMLGLTRQVLVKAAKSGRVSKGNDSTYDVERVHKQLLKNSHSQKRRKSTKSVTEVVTGYQLPLW
jgi:hypothetical protein